MGNNPGEIRGTIFVRTEQFFINSNIALLSESYSFMEVERKASTRKLPKCPVVESDVKTRV